VTRHQDRLGSFDRLNSRAHGGLELDDRGRRCVGGVDRLAVHDDRQAQTAGPFGEQPGQHVEVDPEVVGVEGGVASLVGEELLLARHHHGAVAQQDPPIAAATSQVAALAVVDRALAHLREIWHLVGQQPGGDIGVAGRAEVVTIGQEDVANPPVPQCIEQAGAVQ
jgi:hypothetical protein